MRYKCKFILRMNSSLPAFRWYAFYCKQQVSYPIQFYQTYHMFIISYFGGKIKYLFSQFH